MGVNGLQDGALPSAGWLEQDGSFTNAERRIQRVRAATRPPGEARPDQEAALSVAAALGAAWGRPTPAQVMDEIARVAPQPGQYRPVRP